MSLWLHIEAQPFKNSAYIGLAYALQNLTSIRFEE